MKKDFNYWKNLYDSNNLVEFNSDYTAQLWLKTKSIMRRELIFEFTEKYSIVLKAKTINEQFKELFLFFQEDLSRSHDQLDLYIKEKNKQILKSLDRKHLVSELYKMRIFEWGGDYQNSLEKYLVSHYVKTVVSYEELMSKFEKEINRAVQGYVLNSWYNHWSSILIEYIFKSHSSVLPTVGQIKNVDFFIKNIPFDLKVTYFPLEYLKYKRREKGFPVELTFLKSKARELSIDFDKTANSSDIYYEIIEKLKDRNNQRSLDVLNQLKSENMGIVKEAQQNPKLLAKWLYENQGEMRFGAENRLFLILVDTDNFSNSWKLKRNLELLKPTINTFLDAFSSKKISDLKVDFNYHGKAPTFTVLTDIIFVLR
ncbi:MAG TPA: hypothetical protein DEG17_10135 [Cyanobacteria bacterium UBA11149]|nr:hypothetical protein [Cyanobacteria bacterium UBA11367]HBE58983.1 hypothetical protein [Cyanobacteria bacterium UBA11366]HBK63023.1 hypothetical protein [Cyanobacteria bacterium UBA11166]HBR76762.1 hypothetical protein [Cyanobacteria bacterium UBA11159]HBS70376.1 hypothetical protein [Cyanobacteria bacterium UBA11153]HBW89207.1 hypothetical protein [Cyanobacteria bacterium UBA11149]HCA97152.1 hypothetical protein [Cyanobacteria bacterium UBA9226]